jgi:hypothetical protein
VGVARSFDDVYACFLKGFLRTINRKFDVARPFKALTWQDKRKKKKASIINGLSNAPKMVATIPNYRNVIGSYLMHAAFQ